MLDMIERQTRLTINQWKIIVAAIRATHARFLRFLPDRLCAGIYRRPVEPHFRPVGDGADVGRLGAVPGAFFWGWMADKVGRRKVFIPTALTLDPGPG